MAHLDGSNDELYAMPRRRQILAKRTQAQRQTERKALGKLRFQIVAPSTEARYFTHVSRFLRFLKEHQKGYPSTFVLLDKAVSEFIESLWESGDPKSWASDTLSGLGHFIPACKPHLVGSWRLHAAWGRAELPARAPPFTPLILYALAQVAVLRNWTDVSVLLILGFHTFARTGELFNARVGDFVLGATSGTWTLPLSKGGQRQGVTESILLNDPFVVLLLRNYCKNKKPGDRLANASPGVMRNRLYTLLEQLKLDSPYRWYSVRRGGATHAYRNSNDISSICVCGRWNSIKTARIYIADAVAQLSELQLTPSRTRRLTSLAVACRPSFLKAL